MVFDKSFEDGVEGGAEYKSLMREMLRGVFCVPAKGVRGMKPFVDRIIGIYGLDGKIWIRVYEVREAEKEKAEWIEGKDRGVAGGDRTSFRFDTRPDSGGKFRRSCYLQE